MMRHVARVGVWSLLAIAWLGCPSGAWAFKLDTHREVNDRATTVSGLNPYLKTELGLRDGSREAINSVIVQAWIRMGGAEEDLFLNNEGGGALNRSLHHFQNPLLPWDEAGLNGRCFFQLFP